MAKLTLTTVGSLGNPISAQATLNANNTAIVGAFENTLSRDGTSPNNMLADLDMDGHRVLNVGYPSAAADAASKEYVDAVAGLVNGEGSSASLVSYLAPFAGAVEQPLIDKLSERVSVEDFGAVGDGITDDTAAIQAAIDAVEATGGIVYFEAKDYKITSTLGINASNVFLVGKGRGQLHTTGTSRDAATALIWAGAAGGNMIHFVPAALSPRRIDGGGVLEIGLYCEGIATNGLIIDCVNGGRYRIYVEHCTGQCILLQNTVATTEVAYNSNLEIDLLFDQSSVGDGHGIYSQFTDFSRIALYGRYRNGNGFIVETTTSCEVWQYTVRQAGGSGNGVVARGGQAGSPPFAASNMIWKYIFTGTGGVTLEGTGGAVTAAVTGFQFLYYAPSTLPTAGTGVTYMLSRPDGSMVWKDISMAASSDTTFDFTGRVNKRMLRMNWTSASADSYWEMRHPPGSVQFRAESDSAANVSVGIFTKGGGTGSLAGASGASTSFSWAHSGGPQLSFYGAALAAKPTVTGSRGGNAALQSLLTQLATLGLITDSTS